MPLTQNLQGLPQSQTEGLQEQRGEQALSPFGEGATG